MSKCNKIISSIVLICFIFNTAVSDFAFGQSSNTFMTDKLAAQSKFSNIQPIKNKDIGDIELWFDAALNHIHAKGLEVTRENLQKFADMPGKLPGKTIFQLERAQFFIHEIPPAEDGVLKIKATRKDLTHGARTYTIEYSSANEQLDVYPEGGSKQRAAEDRSAIDRYEETNEKIIDKFTAERIAEGNFAEIEGRAKALGWDNLYPVRMKPKSYWPKQLMDTVSKDISRVLSIFGLSLDEAFEGKNIVFIKVPPGMSLPVIKIDEREVLVDCHTSNNAVYLFLKEEEFAFIEKSLEGGAEISVTDLEGVRSGYLSSKIFHEVGVAYGLYRMRLDTGGILSDLDLAGLLYTSLGLKKEELIQRFPQLRNLVTVDLDTNLATRDYAAGIFSESPLADGEGGLIDKLKSALSRKGMSAKEVDEVISLYRMEIRPRFLTQDKFSTPELIRAVLRVVISRINSNEDPIRLFNILKKADFSKVDAGIELGDFLRDTFTASPLTQTLQVSQRPSSQAATEANTAQYSPERPAFKGAAHSSILEDAEINIRRAADIMKLDPELLELILKPKRITSVKFEILLDSGERKTFYAFRVLQNDALGAGKGGIRWLVVTGETLEEAMKTAAGLATLMTTKNAVINIPYGGAKGDIVIPVGDYTLNDQARIVRAFSHELTKERAIGPFIDVLAPDQGTDARMMAWFLDQNLADLTERGEIFDKTIEAELKRVKASDDPQKTPHLDRYVEVLDNDKDGVLQGFELGTITGKPIGKGGSESRTKATGFGGFLAIKNVLRHFELVDDFDKDTVGRTLNKKVKEVLKKGLKHMTAAVQGAGNVGEYHAWELYRAGVPIIILEDAVLEGTEHINYTLYHPDGIDIELLNKNLERLPNGRWASLKTLKNEFLRTSGYRLIRNDKRFFWKTHTNIKVPAAAESVITSENAEDVNCEIVNELANDPTTPDADRRLRERGILIIPDSFANTGGVGFSYYEWLQNIEGRYHKGATLDKMFEERMSIEADVLFAFAEKYGTDLRMAAYIMYLARVGNAEIARSDELSNKFTDKDPYMYYGELGLAPATVEELNRMIMQGKFDQFINKTDELKSREIDAIAGQVLDKFSGEETGFVLASGATTSGKLGFVVSLTDRLRSAGRRVIRLNFDALKLADLEALRDGKAITAIDYIAGKKMMRTIMPKRGDIFVVEGNYAIEDEVLNAIPEKNRITMWINKIPSVKLEDNWPLTSLDDRLLGNILTVYHTEGREAIDVIRGWPAERKVQMERVFPTWVNADITFNAYLPYELPIIKFYVEDMVTKAMEIAKRDNDKTSIKIIERLQRTLKGVIAVKIPDNISVNPIIQQYIGDDRFYGALVDINNTQAAMENNSVESIARVAVEMIRSRIAKQATISDPIRNFVIPVWVIEASPGKERVVVDGTRLELRDISSESDVERQVHDFIQEVMRKHPSMCVDSYLFTEFKKGMIAQGAAWETSLFIRTHDDAKSGVAETQTPQMRIISVSTGDEDMQRDLGRLAQEVNMAEIISTLGDRSGKWATKQFKDMDGKGSITDVTMLDWVTQTDKTEPQMKDIRKFAEKVREEESIGKTTDLVVVGLGGSIECIKMLLGIFGTDAKSPNVHYLDTVDPIAVSDVLGRIDLTKTRFIAITKSFTTLEVVSLYKIFFSRMTDAAKKAGVSSEEMAKRVTIITDESTDVTNKGKFEIAKTGMGREVFRISRGTGGRFSWDTPVSILTSMIMGHPVDQLRVDAVMIERLSVTETDINKNPAAHYALFKVLMHRNGRFVSTLLIPPALKSAGTWSGQLNDESLGKEAISEINAGPVRALTLDHEPIANDLYEYGNNRYFVVLKLGEDDSTFESEIQKLRKAGFPVYEIVIPLKDNIAQYMKIAEFATLFTGYLLGTNPVVQPNVNMYKDKQVEYVSKGESADSQYVIEAGPVKVDFSSSIGETKVKPEELDSLMSVLGTKSPASVTAVLMYLAAKEKGKDYVVQMIYRRLTPELRQMQDLWRAGVRSALKGIPVLGEEAPCILHAKQQGFQASADKGFFIFARYMDYGDKDIGIPGLGYSLGKLVRAQARGTLDALTSVEKRVKKGEFYNGMGVIVDLRDTSPETQKHFEEYLKETIACLTRLEAKAQAAEVENVPSVVAETAPEADTSVLDLIQDAVAKQDLKRQERFDIVNNVVQDKYPALAPALQSLKYLVEEPNPDTIILAVNKVTDSPLERLILRRAFLGENEGLADNYLERLGHQITAWLKAGDYARVREQLLDSGRTYLDKASYRDYELKPPKNRDLDRELEVLRNVLCYTEDGSKFLKSQYYTSIVGVARVRFAMAFGLPMQGVEIKGSTAKVEILSKIYKNPTRQDNDYRNTRRSIGDRINPEEFTVVRISGFNEYLIIDKENKFASYISASVERGALVASFHIYNPLPISANSVEKPEFGQTPSGMPADVSEESMAENIEFKLGQKLSLFEDAGKQIPTAPDTRYTLLVDNNIYKGDECEKDIEGYALVDGRHIGAADRFNLEKVNTSDVNNILEHVRDSARTVIQLSRELSAEELKLLNEKAAGIRVVRIDTTYFKNDRELSADQRRDCRFDLYAMMLLARQVTQEDKDRYSSVYRSLAFMLNTHYKEGGEVVSDDYIDAILKGDMLFIVKHNLSYRPAGRWKVPDYNTIAAALISA